MTRSFDTFRADVVRRLYEVISRVNSSADLNEVLEEIAQGVVEGLRYGVAAISRLEGDTLVMSTVAGDTIDLAELIGRRTPAENVLGREFSIADHWGILRFVPHDRLPPEQIESLWVPHLEVTDDPDAWHPLDALYAPLYSSTGELLGNMAVDLPPDNKIPNQEQRELLEMFAVQAGLALENAQRRDSLSRQVRLGEALKQLALLAGHVELQGALEGAVVALSDALPVAQVVVRCFADNVEDHEDYAVGAPHSPRAPMDTVDLVRADLVRHAAQGGQRPHLFSLPDDDFPGLMAAPVIRQQAELFGGSHGLLAPVGVDREVLGYLVVLRDETQPRFEPEEVDAVHEAGRELGRLVRDVRLRRTERRLLAEMRELDRYKGELIATISHELKTPLTSIIGHTELLEEAGVQPASVGAISRNAARLDRLVTNLLNYSRIQGRRELHRVSLDLGEACHASLEMLRIQAQTADVDLHLVEPGVPGPRDGRRRRAAPGDRQPLQQRREVHPGRRTGRGLRAGRRRSRRGPGRRHRARHLLAGPGAPVLGVPPVHEPAGADDPGHRPGARDLAHDRRAARRRHHGRVRARDRQRVHVAHPDRPRDDDHVLTSRRPTRNVWSL